MLCDESTGFDEVDTHFAREANTMIDIVYDFDKDCFRIF